MNARFLSRPLLLVSVLAIVATVTTDASRELVDANAHRFKAIAFDYFVLFNADSIVADVERVFPEKGRDLTNAWRTRQFEYAWLRPLTGRYVDFTDVTADALVYAANTAKVQLSTEDKQQLVNAYLHLQPWPDTVDALRRLRQANIRVITISNFSPRMLQANVEQAGITGLFDALVSTDANHTYKPDAGAYQLGLDVLHVAKDDILFAAFGGWDAAGARAFGYPTVWVNRLNQPAEELGIRPDYVVSDMQGVLDVVLGAR